MEYKTEDMRKIKDIISKFEECKKDISFLQNLPENYVKIIVSNKESSFLEEKHIVLSDEEVKLFKEFLINIFTERKKKIKEELTYMFRKVTFF